MRHFSAPRRNLKGATTSWSLPISFLTGCLAFITPAVVFASSSFSPAHAEPPSGLMQQWRAYALDRITPDFAWAEHADQPVTAPTVLDRVAAGRRSLRMPLDDQGQWMLTLDLLPRAQLLPAGSEHDVPASSFLLDSLTQPFSSSAANTGLSRDFGRYGQIDLGVVLVQQRFASSFLAGEDFSANRSQPGLLALPTSSRGTGMQIGMQGKLLQGLDWFASWRSRVNMDAFRNFRGIYGKPGDLDIPARMKLGLSWSMTPATRVRAAMEHIEYSDTQPFTSSALPRKLLALLGDATSPEFSWRDLSIYSVSVTHDLDAHNSFSVRFSSGQQPEPTSELLARALMQDAADYSVGLGYVYRSPGMQWRLMANYAPAEFVLGLPTSTLRSNQSESNSSQLEFESVWMWQF